MELPKFSRRMKCLFESPAARSDGILEGRTPRWLGEALLGVFQSGERLIVDATLRPNRRRPLALRKLQPSDVLLEAKTACPDLGSHRRSLPHEATPETPHHGVR